MTMGRTIVSCPAAFAVFIMCIGLLYRISAANVSISFPEQPKGEVGGNATISCEVFPETANISWTFGNKIVTLKPEETINKRDQNDQDGTIKLTKTSTITIINATKSDAGLYTCMASLGNDTKTKTAQLNLYFEPKWINGSDTLTVFLSKESEETEAWCAFEAYIASTVNWYLKDRPNMDTISAQQISPRMINSTYKIKVDSMQDNGTYVCEINEEAGESKVSKAVGNVIVVVKSNPTLSVTKAIGISTTEIYLQWNISLNNVNVSTLHYSLNISKIVGNTLHSVFPKTPPSNNTSFVISNLTKSTSYLLELYVQAEKFAWNLQYSANVSTLAFDPKFTPNISINGFSATSVTIGLQKPPEDVAPFFHYYILEANQKDEVPRTAFHSIDETNLPYMFDNLKPHSTYTFKVHACSEYTDRCDDWSSAMEAATSDGMPSKPTAIKLICSTTFANLTWGPPETPNAEIKGYTMELTGNATYKDRNGSHKLMTWGPLSKFTTNDTFNVVFNDLQPNTDYYVKLSAMTRTRRRGSEGGGSCKTGPAPPDHPPRPRWKKILQGDKYLFKMYLPRLSERNGQICCYRVYMVHLLPNSDWSNLPEAKKIMVLDHKQAHGDPPKLAAYITDIFSNSDFPLDSELVMGDNQSHFNRSAFDAACGRCVRRPDPPTTTTTTTTTTTAQTTTVDDLDASTMDPAAEEPERTRRSSNKDFKNDETMRDSTADQLVGGRDLVEAQDGPLDGSANYTLFVEVISKIKDEPPMYSDYVNIMMPAATPTVTQPTSAIEIALQVTCAVAALVLLLMIIFCIRQTRRSRKMPPHAPLEMNSLQAAIRHMFGGRPRQQPPSAPPTMDPIPKDELAAAYAERQVNSDYGFQQEFELLPDYYPDRTTQASEARENQPKNRYPDIKAYDQTRVKLTPIDGVPGSDYINANYVMGYQDRKQFICAQGPTDTTVNDFWRMIWEQGLELVVMLTNLEECTKVKCSQYWPEPRGERAFGLLTVQHVSEKRYSDYIVRELRISKSPMNSDGLPIVEGNGIAKRNGDCKEPSDESVPTSPREARAPESRTVRQYHFLMWKDFAAPEHAYSILKFIKRVNEAWSSMLCRACVVHCSAGVGRTGTLAALDCLLAQLAAEGRAAVFNTVADLRRSRNFLVQSLKQYVFVYRALVEYAHYGDTEIPAARLKGCVDRLRNTPPLGADCLMEVEFEKIQNCPIQEPVKSCAAGAAEELRAKNRCVDILPYDRNRVILSPLPGRDYSTYINASFIEAYDNSEGFIITQDPMASTIVDFWRMVSEHNVTTIVMLSELGEGKCPRYWDDGTAQYEHISVQYEDSESCPYYTRRQFRVVNNKSGCTSNVLQLQYQGWPTAAGHVPEVTRGLAELADAAAPNQGTMLVHCHLGTERSALFVALCILITQLRAERRVDVCCVARKVRTQRVKTINTFLQYEFLHRAILNYAELHNLLEDS